MSKQRWETGKIVVVRRRGRPPMYLREKKTYDAGAYFAAVKYALQHTTEEGDENDGMDND